MALMAMCLSTVCPLTCPCKPTPHLSRFSIGLPPFIPPLPCPIYSGFSTWTGAALWGRVLRLLLVKGTDADPSKTYAPQLLQAFPSNRVCSRCPLDTLQYKWEVCVASSFLSFANLPLSCLACPVPALLLCLILHPKAHACPPHPRPAAFIQPLLPHTPVLPLDAPYSTLLSLRRVG